MDVKISRGVDIKLKGVADRVYANVPNSKFYALKPTDFHLVIATVNHHVDWAAS